MRGWLGALTCCVLAFGTTMPACSSRDSVAPPSLGDAGDVHPLCVDGMSVDGAYPKRAYSISLLGTLPDLAFDALDAAGAPAKVSLHDYFEPCAAQSRLLVIRVSAGWCGTCRWHAARTKELTQLDVGARLELLDLLVANDDNAPASTADLPAWSARIDAPEKLAIDPAFQLKALNGDDRFPIPLFALVDTRTMVVRNYLNDPDPDVLALRIRQELASLDIAPLPVPPPPQTFDGRFNRKQWDMIHEITFPTTPPADPTNAQADDANAAALGKQLFSDATLSPSGSVSCATCHAPDKQFTDGLQQSEGTAHGDRNAPAVALASHARWQFWDGRADSLWAQALGPFENPKEFRSSRLFIDHAIFDRYKSTYEATFGPLPALADAVRFPASGKPGDPAWMGMTSADQLDATRVYVNVGKAIAAFERSLRVKPNALDAYIAGDSSALTDPQKDGLRAFFSAGCAECHYGPRLTDDAFHVVRYTTGRQDGQWDRGRLDGVPLLLAGEFIETSMWSDSQVDTHGLALITASPSLIGQMKTPPLRGVATTAPYGHGGTIATLVDIAELDRSSGVDASDPRSAGLREPWLAPFDTATRDALPPFLSVLTADNAP